jgi:hypothetical protein
MGARTGRWTAELEGDVVVFLLGMHVNRWRDVRAWWPVTRAMPRMLRELEQHPGLGLLHASPGWFLGGPSVVQYWRSFEQLEAYSRDRDAAHLPAWRRFNQRVRASGDVGIRHETYRVRAGEYEAVYGNMPPWGLANAGEHHPAGSTSTAARRLGERDDDVAPVGAY